MNRNSLVISACLVLLVTGAVNATDLGTSFTYQGELKQGGDPVNGSADFQFTLWEAANGGNPVGSTIELLAQGVVDGVFSLQLDFGASPFAGAARWLEIHARYPAGSGEYVLLTPRQPIQATPYATFATEVKDRGFRETGEVVHQAHDEKNVSIGTTQNLAKLHVQEWDGNDLTIDDLSGETVLIDSEDKAILGLYSSGQGNTGSALILAEDWGGGTPDKWAVYRTGGNGTPPNQFRFGSGSSGSYASYPTWLAINATGNVGIGTTSPATKLDVAGTAKMTGFRMPTGAANGYVLKSDANGNGTWGLISGDAVWERNGYDIYYDLGNVGIGTSLPTARLTVDGNVHVSPLLTVDGEVSVSSEVNLPGVEVLARGYQSLLAGVVTTRGSNNSYNALLTYLSTKPYCGYVSARDGFGNTLAAIYADGASGYMFADVKNFREPSRQDNSKDIWYACVEGPEVAAYVRGTATLVAGAATVTLPDHFREVATAEGMTVQVTPRSAQSLGLAVVERDLDHFVVRELAAGAGNYEFDWEVKAVRRGYQNYEVVRPWDEALPAGMSKEAEWEARLRNIEERERQVQQMENQGKGR